MAQIQNGQTQMSFPCKRNWLADFYCNVMKLNRSASPAISPGELKHDTDQIQNGSCLALRAIPIFDGLFLSSLLKNQNILFIVY